MSVRRNSLFASAVWLLSAVATLACDLPDIRTDDRPPPLGEPTEVTIGIVVADILGIDDPNQQIDIDLVVGSTWTDPRLAALDGCTFSRSDVWAPELAIYNSSNLRTAFRNAQNRVNVGPAGRITHRQRVTGNISSYHNLRRFPFDRHNIEIEIGSTDFQEAVHFVADTNNTWLADRLNIEGWTIHSVVLNESVSTLPSSGQPIDMLTLVIDAERNGDFYIFRVLLALFFVVGMSWTIFWVPPSRFEFQIGLGATSMLTVIAFSFAISSNLPPLGYLTTMDKIIVWAVILVFLSIVEALITGLLAERGQTDLALQIDQVARVAFPVALIGGWTIMGVF